MGCNGDVISVGLLLCPQVCGYGMVSALNKVGYINDVNANTQFNKVVLLIPLWKKIADALLQDCSVFMASTHRSHAVLKCCIALKFVVFLCPNHCISLH